MMIIAGIVALLCFTYSAEGNVFISKKCSLRVSRYQRSIHYPYIEEGQTEKEGKRDKQRSTKNTHKTKDRVT